MDWLRVFQLFVVSGICGVLLSLFREACHVKSRLGRPILATQQISLKYLAPPGFTSRKGTDPPFSGSACAASTFCIVVFWTRNSLLRRPRGCTSRLKSSTRRACARPTQERRSSSLMSSTLSSLEAATAGMRRIGEFPAEACAFMNDARSAPTKIATLPGKVSGHFQQRLELLQQTTEDVAAIPGNLASAANGVSALLQHLYGVPVEARAAVNDARSAATTIFELPTKMATLPGKFTGHFQRRVELLQQTTEDVAAIPGNLASAANGVSALLQHLYGLPVEANAAVNDARSAATTIFELPTKIATLPGKVTGHFQERVEPLQQTTEDVAAIPGKLATAVNGVTAVLQRLCGLPVEVPRRITDAAVAARRAVDNLGAFVQATQHAAQQGAAILGVAHGLMTQVQRMLTEQPVSLPAGVPPAWAAGQTKEQNGPSEAAKSKEPCPLVLKELAEWKTRYEELEEKHVELEEEYRELRGEVKSVIGKISASEQEAQALLARLDALECPEQRIAEVMQPFKEAAVVKSSMEDAPPAARAEDCTYPSHTSHMDADQANEAAAECDAAHVRVQHKLEETRPRVANGYHQDQESHQQSGRSHTGTEQKDEEVNAPGQSHQPSSRSHIAMDQKEEVNASSQTAAGCEAARLGVPPKLESDQLSSGSHTATDQKDEEGNASSPAEHEVARLRVHSKVGDTKAPIANGQHEDCSQPSIMPHNGTDMKDEAAEERNEVRLRVRRKLEEMRARTANGQRLDEDMQTQIPAVHMEEMVEEDRAGWRQARLTQKRRKLARYFAEEFSNIKDYKLAEEFMSVAAGTQGKLAGGTWKESSLGSASALQAVQGKAPQALGDTTDSEGSEPESEPSALETPRGLVKSPGEAMCGRTKPPLRRGPPRPWPPPREEIFGV